ncbi:hypothetical protein BWI97_22935 [Siphonobacter sp. BAB-5405]|uniref:hypothetical protein n=1 Tax=Siphonobacter sp. BAB-5405 TaxID=1864825 RepID=UPI000CC06E93|nr:hypothetical protein [Siphonobacter sp. BAB-5405]PMD90349.1 hypothetical protein BWI97_22935 [Siphonobacter sp. BAB-5405]
MKWLYTSIVMVLFSSLSYAQRTSRFESSLFVEKFNYFIRGRTVDPSPDWKGDYLPPQANGFRLTSVNGWVFKEMIHAGLGLSYARIAGINGMMAFADLRADFSTQRFTPYFYLNPGYSHFWNQYEGGTATFLLETGLGAGYRLKGKSRILASVGLLGMQQKGYLTGKIGCTF